jgi:fructose-bisphosphate aldolase class II
MSSPDLSQNKTKRILDHAQKHNYAVPAVNCYTIESILATVKAAKAEKSPAIIQVFPWALHAAENRLIAKVAVLAASTEPTIAVHIDHCQDYEDCKLAMDLGFDSVMVDMSHYEPAENAQKTKELTERAHSMGITVEAEMGRIDGAEDGVEAPDMDGLLTEPQDAVRFIAETKVDYLAPAFGNMHGAYPKDGPGSVLQLDRLQRIREACPENVHLVLHGFSDFPDNLILECIKAGGIRKVNVNKTICERYMQWGRKAWAAVPEGKHIGLTSWIEGAMDAHYQDIIEHMRIFQSSGKAALI